MLSLPLPPPTQPDVLRSHFHRADSPTPRSTTSGSEHPHRQHQPNNNAHSKKANQIPIVTPHAQLLADEATLAHRKLQIRNFGSTWIRPPGVPKTLQAMREEEDEMREMEEMARQEQGLADLRARTVVEEARAEAQAGEDAEGEVEAVERDLDDEIPDADAAHVGEGEEGMEEDVTFNEESIFAEGSLGVLRNDEDVAVMEEAELTGAARDEEELGIEHERDLDDSVPEAGSYQHTDTEVEDSSSSSEDDAERPSEANNSFLAQSARRDMRERELQRRQQREDGSPVASGGAFRSGLQERMRAQTAIEGSAGTDALTRSPGSLNLSSSMLESSFAGSSPVVLRGRGGGGRRRRGRLS